MGKSQVQSRDIASATTSSAFNTVPSSDERITLIVDNTRCVFFFFFNTIEPLRISIHIQRYFARVQVYHRSRTFHGTSKHNAGANVQLWNRICKAKRQGRIRGGRGNIRRRIQGYSRVLQGRSHSLPSDSHSARVTRGLRLPIGPLWL